MKLCGMHYSWEAHGTVSAGSIGPCVLDEVHAVDHRDQYGNEWPVVGWGNHLPALADEPVSVPPPARCGYGIAVDGAWLRCQNTPDHDGLHIAGRSRWRTGGTLESQPTDEPTVVPPPVDALLDPMDELTRRLAIYGSVCEDLGESGYAKREPADVKGVADAVLDYARRSIADAFARGVEEGRRQATEERTEVEYGVRVDAVHPSRKEKVGTVMTHLGEQKSRMCHDIWDGWTPVKRTVLPAVHGRWEALDEAERLRAPWKRDAEAVDHG